MPALPVIADTYRCALNWRSSTGQIAVNVIHIHTAGAAVGPDAVFECMEDNVGTNLWACCSDTAVVERVSITPLDGSSATHDYAPSVPAGWTGGEAGDFSPASAAVVKLTTALRGRSHRGRIFLPMIGEAAMSDGLLNSTLAANMATAWTAFNTGMNADPTTPQRITVASYKLGSDLAVLTFNVEVPLGTQRRRQGRLRTG